MIKFIQMRNGEERHLERNCRGMINNITVSATNPLNPSSYEEYMIQFITIPMREVVYQLRVSEGLTFVDPNLVWQWENLGIRISSPAKRECSFTITIHYADSESDIMPFREMVEVIGFTQLAEIDKLSKLIGPLKAIKKVEAERKKGEPEPERSRVEIAVELAQNKKKPSKEMDIP